MLEWIIFVLGLSLILYILLAGADFGAGILELFSKSMRSEKREKLVYKAIGPIWEANHIWIILVVVILFVGFPKIYSTITNYLHLPVLLYLIGVVLRGSTFAFRHNDAIEDSSHKIYSAIFMVSSLWSPLFLGIIAGALLLGRIDPDAATFYEAYVAPWLNLFCLSVGIFTCCMVSFLAAVYLIGETTEQEEKSILIRQATVANILTVVSGGLVFVIAHLSGVPLVDLFVNDLLALTCIVIATLSLPVLWLLLRSTSVIWERVVAGLQISLILIAWIKIKYPVVIFMEQSKSISLIDAVAPNATIKGLGWALIIGAAIIFPAFFYLLKTFKWNPALNSEH